MGNREVICGRCEKIIIRQSDMYFCVEDKKVVCKTCFLRYIQEKNNEE